APRRPTCGRAWRDVWALRIADAAHSNQFAEFVPSFFGRSAVVPRKPAVRGLDVCSVKKPCSRRPAICNAVVRRAADVTDQERQKAEEMISRLETAVGQIFPRDSGNASLIATMIQTLNGLRSLLGIVRPH